MITVQIVDLTTGKTEEVNLNDSNIPKKARVCHYCGAILKKYEIRRRHGKLICNGCASCKN